MTNHNKISFINSLDMRALELNAEYFGISTLQLMENAGCCIASEIASRFEQDKSIMIFCGVGGNGGDGFVAARHLLSKGFRVKIVLAGKEENIKNQDALKNYNILKIFNEIPIIKVIDSSNIPEINSDIVIDALLGIGSKGVLKPPLLQLVKKIGSSNAFCISVDVPTGINADTGEVMGEAVKADVTITFHKTKKGLELAKDYVGKVIVRKIGIPNDLEKFTGPGDILKIKKFRSLNSHKGDYGRLLIIGGNEIFSGAPTLAGLAALRTGVDLTYIATPEKTGYSIASMSPDLISIKLKGDKITCENLKTLTPFLEIVDAIVLGPGIGLHLETKKATKILINMIEKIKKPLLLDADGLKIFAEIKRKMSNPTVLTPHSGEYTILTGNKLTDDVEDRVNEVIKTSNKLGSVILLKGSTDIISNGIKSKLNFTGNPGMTVGGTGDVLSGIIGALLAQSADPFQAAVAGAFVNGAAGDLAFKDEGPYLIASDLLKYIPKILMNPMIHEKRFRLFGKKS